MIRLVFVRLHSALNSATPSPFFNSGSGVGGPARLFCLKADWFDIGWSWFGTTHLAYRKGRKRYIAVGPGWPTAGTISAQVPWGKKRSFWYKLLTDRGGMHRFVICVALDDPMEPRWNSYFQARWEIGRCREGGMFSFKAPGSADEYFSTPCDWCMMNPPPFPLLTLVRPVLPCSDMHPVLG